MKKRMRAAIFDMDGLLIDSEPLWREAEVEVFGSVGVPLTDEMCRETTGMRHDAVVRYWHERYPWDEPGLEEMTANLVEAAQSLIVERGVLMAGAEKAIRILHQHGLRLAIASSSPLSLIEAVVKKFELSNYFPVLHSADDEKFGKPDPAVYLSTMSTLGVSPGECVALEDSVSGIRAAKAAGAFAIAVPDPVTVDEPEFAEADVVLSSLEDFSTDLI
ncbi:MAG: hexitol phosphatase HxpB [Woeseiaceae bacterium]